MKLYSYITIKKKPELLSPYFYYHIMIVITILIIITISIIIIINIFFTIKNCDKTLLKNILRLKKLLKSDDVSTLAERHYQVKLRSDFWSINTKKQQ